MQIISCLRKETLLLQLLSGTYHGRVAALALVIKASVILLRRKKGREIDIRLVKDVFSKSSTRSFKSLARRHARLFFWLVDDDVVLTWGHIKFCIVRCSLQDDTCSSGDCDSGHREEKATGQNETYLDPLSFFILVEVSLLHFSGSPFRKHGET